MTASSCRPEFKQDADEKLSRIRSGDTSGKELLFVGLHVRRGDYVEFGRQVLNEKKRWWQQNGAHQVLGEEEMDPGYFIEATNHFREDFPDNQIYFVAVSDDLAWVVKHLGKITGLVVAGSHGQDQEDHLDPVGKDHVDTVGRDHLNPVGRDHLDPVGRDLALLAACNHTIVSQGMYGAWGAFLAGGDMFTKYGVLVQHVLS